MWRLLFAMLGVLCVPRMTRAQERDPDPEPSQKSFQLFGLAELELVDVEGAGGFANQDPGLVRPERRAATVDIDKVCFDFFMQLERRLRARAELRADAQVARVDRLYLEALALDRLGWQVRFEAGRQKPMARPVDRRVETWSPQGALFWRGREWHLGGEARFRGRTIDVDAVASVAMQRDLGDEVMGEDSGMPSIAFINGAPRQGSAVEVGGLLGAGARGAYAAVFGFRGRLLDNDGPARLERTFPDYELLGDVNDRTNLWFGGRAGYTGHGVFAFTEVIGQHLGLVRRRGFEIGGSYMRAFRVRGRRIEIEPLLRYGLIAVTNLPAVPLIPESWDREQVVAALLVRPSTSVELKIEYLFLRENTAQLPGEELAMDDDQLLVQLRLTRELL
jgi:hypothetical protein